VRPTFARAKASLFDILTSRGLVEGARILDLFAGSGALGIEALSRGAESVLFVERDHVAARVLRANVAAHGFEARSSLMVRSVAHALPQLARRGDPFDGVFVDPPYSTRWVDLTLRRLEVGRLVREGGWVVIHHRRGDDPASAYGALVASVRRRVGDAVLVLYRREPPRTARD
jgi:16S rRNA (guanine(966)-N(2))-methyltransferase RsmD